MQKSKIGENVFAFFWRRFVRTPYKAGWSESLWDKINFIVKIPNE